MPERRNRLKGLQSHATNPLIWLGRLDSNQGMAESKSAALPLGYAPTLAGNSHTDLQTVRAARTIAAAPCPINGSRVAIYVDIEPVAGGLAASAKPVPRLAAHALGCGP